MDGKNDNEGKDRKHDILKETGLTYDDYAAIDDGNRYELVEGQLELMTAPPVIHQMVSFEMQKKIAGTCESDYIVLHAPIDVILSSDEEVRQPDIVLVHRDRTDIIKKRGIVGAPDLVVEILSPSTLKRDKIDKLHTYAHYQIPEYWIVEPNNGYLEQYILQNDQYTLHNIFQGDDTVSSPNIPCVSFTMGEIMGNIPDIED